MNTVTIQNIKAFRRWQKWKARQTAAKRQVEQLAEAAGLPAAKDFEAGTEGILVNKQKKPVAKFTVYAVGEKIIPAFKACRIS